MRSVSRVPNAPRPDNHDDNDNEPVPGADDDMLEIDPSLRVDEGAGTANGTSRQHEDENGRLKQDAGRLNEDDADQSESEDLGPLQDVQILDLHSKRPVISYRGHVFEGQWAEMIGTDLILAHHEPGSEDPLPALRNLAGDIDILAASSSRILTTKKTLKPRVAEEDSLAPIRKDWNINIPVGKSKNADRVHQADFLERLIALKIKKGDKDKVTVYARDGEGKHFQDDKDPAYRPRRKRTTDVWEEGKRKRRRSGRPPGRPSKRASQQRGISHGEPEPEILSVPTPKRWEDLEGEGEDEDEGLEDIEDIEDIEEEEEEAVLSGDEDDDQDESDDDVEGENVGDDDQSVGDEDSGDEGDTMEAG